MLYAGLAAIVLSVYLVALLIYRVINTRRHIGRQRLEDYQREIWQESPEAQLSLGEESRDIFESKKSKGLFSSTRAYKSLENKLAQGDIYLYPGEFVLIVLVWRAILGGLLYLISRIPMMFILGVIMSIIFGNIHLNSRMQRKVRAFNNQIVDMLTLMSNGLKAGFSLLQTIGIVSEDMQPPISREFGRMLRQINMGLPLEDGLNELLDRVKSPDLELVVTAILIQRQVGGNLSEVLDNISHTIRERVILKNQVKVLTSQGRLSGIIISLLAPALAFIIYMMNPEFMVVLVKEPLGIVMLVVAVILQIIGVVFIRRIVDIDI
jgi:tight adherence protein B